MDTNSSHFAKYCFSLGINLKRIEVIADDEAEIGTCNIPSRLAVIQSSNLEDMLQASNVISVILLFQ